MRQRALKEKVSYWVGVISIGVILGSSLQFAKAWVGPTGDPLHDNIGAPINTGSMEQYKSGGLGIEGVIKGYSGAIFDGNVGIGTTSPQARLAINGDSNQDGLVIKTNSTADKMSPWSIRFYNNFAMSNGYAPWGIEGAYDGSFRISRSQTDIAFWAHRDGSVELRNPSSQSDQRLKHDISTIHSALDKVMQLRGVDFKWNSSDKPSMGVIAQEVEKVFPEAVSTNDNDGMKSVSYDGLTGALIEAVKQQQKEVESLKALLCKDHPTEEACK